MVGFKFDKEKRIEKLSFNEREELLFDLLNAFRVLKNDEETALFVRDLLTLSEVRNLSKRLGIAKLLIEGKTYEEIEQILHTSHGTVAKVASWLSEKGEGFRKVISRIPRIKERKTWASMTDAERFMHRYSLYFWPELLLKEVFEGGKEIDRSSIYSVFEDLRRKGRLNSQIAAQIKRYYSKEYSTT